MKKKDGVAIGAVALFALTGCVTDMTYATKEPCAQDLSVGSNVQSQVVAAHYSGTQDFGGGNYQNHGQNPGGQHPGGQHPGQHPGGQKPPVDGNCPDPLNPPVNGQCSQSSPMPVCEQPSQFPPSPQPGECYEQCIVAAQFMTKYQPIQTCAPCPIPSVDQTGMNNVSVPVVVKEAAQKVVIPASVPGVVNVEINPAYTTWVLEKDAVWGKREITIGNCHPEQVFEPVYNSVDKEVLGPVYTEIIPIPSPLVTTQQQVMIKDASTKWVRKTTSCTPEDIKNGLSDCSTLCLEITPAVYTTITISECQGKDQACSFDRIDHPTSKVVQVQVPTPIVLPPQPPCEVKVVDVMLETPVYRQVDVAAKSVDIEVCSAAEPQYYDIPAVTQNIDFQVPVFEEKCTPVPAVTDCFPLEVQVCDPVVVWKQVICEDNRTVSKMTNVQQALSQAGFNPGPIDGNLHSQTQQAIREFQMSKGLAQGGLTIETLEALGIYE